MELCFSLNKGIDDTLWKAERLHKGFLIVLSAGPEKTCGFSPGATEFSTFTELVSKNLHKIKFGSLTYQANLEIR